MKIFNKFLIITTLLLLFINCTNKQSQQSTIKPASDSLQNQENIDSISAKSSIAWAGDYVGTIPAANLIGMDMRLSLSSFDKYKLEIKTLNDNPKDNRLFTYSGNLEWEKDSTTFQLIGIDSLSNKFKISKNAIIYLNPDGTPNSGPLSEFYKLKKVKN